jgi:hypothetical protein
MMNDVPPVTRSRASRLTSSGSSWRWFLAAFLCAVGIGVVLLTVEWAVVKPSVVRDDDDDDDASQKKVGACCGLQEPGSSSSDESSSSSSASSERCAEISQLLCVRLGGVFYGVDTTCAFEGGCPHTVSPTGAPTTAAPTTAAPTGGPSFPPTRTPTGTPTTRAPTRKPTHTPTAIPPTAAPTPKPPTPAPVAGPTLSPSTPTGACCLLGTICFEHFPFDLCPSGEWLGNGATCVGEQPCGGVPEQDGSLGCCDLSATTDGFPTCTGALLETSCVSGLGGVFTPSSSCNPATGTCGPATPKPTFMPVFSPTVKPTLAPQIPPSPFPTRMPTFPTPFPTTYDTCTVDNCGNATAIDPRVTIPGGFCAFNASTTSDCETLLGATSTNFGCTSLQILNARRDCYCCSRDAGSALCPNDFCMSATGSPTAFCARLGQCALAKPWHPQANLIGGTGVSCNNFNFQLVQLGESCECCDIKPSPSPTPSPTDSPTSRPTNSPTPSPV